MKEYNVQGTKFRFRLFDKITTPEEAYFIGYLAGDGGYARGTHKRRPRMNVSSSDKSTIDFITSTFCPDTKFRKIWPVNKQRDIVSTKHCYVLNFSSTMTPTFEKFGILGLKKDRVCVNIPKKFMVDYVRGLFDADGHISYNYRKDRNRLSGHVGFTHQSYKVLEAVQRFLEENDISSSIKPRKEEACIDLKFAKIDNIYKFIDLIYPTDSYCLESKQKKCEEFKTLPYYLEKI